MVSVRSRSIQIFALADDLPYLVMYPISHELTFSELALKPSANIDNVGELRGIYTHHYYGLCKIVKN